MVEDTAIRDSIWRPRATTNSSNYQLIIGAPLLVMVVFCFSYLLLSHTPRPVTGHPTVSRSLPVVSSQSETPLAVYAVLTDQTPLTTQDVPADTNQALPAQATAHVPDPASNNPPQAAAQSNQLLQNNPPVHQPDSDPQKALLHLVKPN